MATSDVNEPSASLRIDHLPETATESQLAELFGAIGDFKSIHIIRDSISNKPLGHGYVNFEDVDSAIEAIKVLDGMDLTGGNDDKGISLSFTPSQPASSAASSGTLFVKNLAEDVDNKTIFDTFASIGAPSSAKVMTTAEGKSRGFAIVHYDDPQLAQRALDELEGVVVNGKNIRLERYQTGAQLKEESRKRTVYLAGLPHEVTDKQLIDLLSPFGSVISVKLYPKDKDRNPVAFVTMEDEQAVLRAVEKLNGGSFERQRITVAQLQARNPATQSSGPTSARQVEETKDATLYVRNIYEDVQDSDLSEAFGVFGPVSRVTIPRSANGDTRGFAFVVFENPEDRAHALAAGNMLEVGGGKVQYSAYRTKEELQNMSSFGMRPNAGAPAANPQCPPRQVGPTLPCTVYLCICCPRGRCSKDMANSTANSTATAMATTASITGRVTTSKEIIIIAIIRGTTRTKGNSSSNNSSSSSSSSKLRSRLVRRKTARQRLECLTLKSVRNSNAHASKSSSGLD
ncbi:uncharacterized protein MONBRDRAFT_38453 [Monosiga brevicollis MX1]|uniref:RRM domain-containing protein n=1 Tax=Monosiga brevicollis TaxID=81824 RepID=A9V7W7_MONBE|nr:uncharacterized protein MONBRDRAFT_38453 [Monosiga brevicollis MX1]EDQ86448.1 predicted protein [Monosiga brevicollis MX1]|eukprot:XP_001748838.1 hypothetical protein [Monosiga brevicollis MX1]